MELLSEKEWVKDMQHNQGWKYVSGDQYIQYLRVACLEAGLLFKSDVIKTEFIAQLPTVEKMNMIMVEMKFTLIDPETGEFLEYMASGEGADFTDKGGYKAKTGAIKYFIRDNFLVGESTDPEEIDTDGKKSKFIITDDEKKEAKTNLMSKANSTQKKAIKGLIGKLLKANKEENQEYVNDLLEKTNSFKDIDSKRAEEIMLELRNKLDKEGQDE